MNVLLIKVLSGTPNGHTLFLYYQKSWGFVRLAILVINVYNFRNTKMLNKKIPLGTLGLLHGSGSRKAEIK